MTRSMRASAILGAVLLAALLPSMAFASVPKVVLAEDFGRVS
ncbi:hypothetical protein ACFL6M_05725 [Candidatus Eisenbacteria bacterium]|uniref:Uncharacterized protein n=1 Tax=Eiseniibacteriota bacterium TaxID=2212470 RepID=A0ABV6YL75_UNCEI